MTLLVLILSLFCSGLPITQGLRTNSALLWNPEKVGVRSPVLIWSPFYWGPPRTQGLHSASHSALLRAPKKVVVRSPILICSRFYSGPPRRQDLRCISTLFGAPEKVGMTLLDLIDVPFLSGNPENARVA